jgi:hypothetical protein
MLASIRAAAARRSSSAARASGSATAAVSAGAAARPATTLAAVSTIPSGVLISCATPATNSVRARYCSRSISARRARCSSASRTARSPLAREDAVRPASTAARSSGDWGSTARNAARSSANSRHGVSVSTVVGRAPPLPSLPSARASSPNDSPGPSRHSSTGAPPAPRAETRTSPSRML